MPKNKGLGGKNRKKGKNENEFEEKELIFKEYGQEYGRVIKMTGSGILDVYCNDDKLRKCHIRGNMKKKIWISKDDIVLINIREYEKDVGDVIHKYLPSEVKNLIAYEEINKSICKNDTEYTNNNFDDEIQFELGNDSEDEL